MTLKELSVQYRTQAEVLHCRINELVRLRRENPPGTDRALLDDRIRILSAMWREARDLAVFTEHYYDRGYRRNVRYTI
jgi:hypothetical protein